MKFLIVALLSFVVSLQAAAPVGFGGKTPSVEILAIDEGFSDVATFDNSTNGATFAALSRINKKVVRFTKTSSGDGVYLFKTQVNWSQDVHIVIDPGVVIKRGDNATGYTWAFTVPQTMGISGGIFDGNKANNSASANRAPMIKYYGFPSARIEGGYMTNYVVGFYDSTSTKGWTMKNFGFYNGAEHEGTYSAVAWHLSCAVNISVAVQDARPHFIFENVEIVNDSDPSDIAKAPGGIIAAGNIASNSLVQVTAKYLYTRRIGQSYPRSGDANHISPFDMYEGTIYCKAIFCEFADNAYGGFKVSNSFSPTLAFSTIHGMDPDLPASDGTAGVQVDINRVLGDAITDYGRTLIIGCNIFDLENVPGIRIAGRGTSDADEYVDAVVANCFVDNPTGRAMQIVSVGGRLNVTGGIYRGAGPSGSSGAVEVQNLDSAGHIFFDGVVIDAYANHGFFATSGIAGSISIQGGRIDNAGTGTTALVALVAERLSVRGVILNGTLGSTHQITGAGTLSWGGNSLIGTSSSITWSNVGNAEGDLEGTGSPEGVVKAVKGRAKFLRSDGGAGYTLYVKEIDTGSASTNGWRTVGGTSTKTTAYTATLSDYMILCDTTSAGFTVTLPPAANASGKIFVIKKISADGNTLTVDADGAETIEDATTKTTTTQYGTFVIQSDGTEWWVQN